MLNLCVQESLAHVSSPGPITITIAFLQSALNRPGFLTVLPPSNNDEVPSRTVSARSFKKPRWNTTC